VKGREKGLAATEKVGTPKSPVKAKAISAKPWYSHCELHSDGQLHNVTERKESRLWQR